MTITHDAMVRNILSLYRLSTNEDVERGASWYPNNTALLREWAAHFKRPLANVACIVAAVSVQCEWSRNLIIADDILHGHPPSIGGAIRRFVDVAERIRDDRATDTADYFKQGPKVRSFAANLAGNYEVVTVDTHAAQIAAGCPTKDIRVDTWKRYEPVARAYVDAAHTAGLPPAYLQGITWHTWKRTYTPAKKRSLRNKW